MPNSPAASIPGPEISASEKSEKTAQWVRADRDRLMHPNLPDSRTERTVMVEGRGCHVRDSSGRKYLDAAAVLGVMQVGHGRSEIVEAATAQMSSLECFHIWETMSNDKAIELAVRVTGLAPPGLERAYFTSGGAEGNEIALRMARYFHYRREQPERTWILSRKTAYHGIGYGSGSVSGLPVYHQGFGPVMPDVHHLTAPDPYHAEAYGGEDVTEFCLRELRETIERIGPERIAAMIGEPVMSVGGAVIPPPDYWPRVAELLRSHGILLIFDEVVTGYGRTGRWFAAEHFGVTPDIMVTAKGITSGYVPHGAVLVSDEVAATVTGSTGFPIGFTYTGHPTACAVALANLDIIEGENLLENAVKTGGYLADRLAPLRDLPAVGDVRQIGLMLGVELVADKTARTQLPTGAAPVVQALREDEGIIVRGNPRSLLINPPLVLDRGAADELADGLFSVLERVGTDGRVRP
ncbi:aspartate aminotransferase family protein [Streptomyces olivoreticuli]|uniref:aminotransferase family protein n=1 Tax=Streptomyces olivoreticuli TaxID=68246 RepID=UPI00265A293D|nr:aspartate aminotransferase family protein [Streptomyces olivoreticuli]WKK23230.1 aspartate aminotransferase family protein [Streptomyces olivoreticuli]